MEGATRELGADPLIGQVFGERYRIERPLGEGGIGRVYVAKHLALGRLVALKVLLQKYESHPMLLQRFEREAQALASLSHPNIVTVTDFGVAEGHPYIVMELLEGQDFAALLAKEVVAPARGLGIVRQMLRALAYAHGTGLVHRDLKPHNIFVRVLPDGSDHVEVLDFGLARFMDDGAEGGVQLTKVGSVLGTPAYMAPEQASGDPADARADVYAAGCVLFEALTGQRVFVGDERTSVLRHHLITPPPTLVVTDAGLEVSPALEALLQRALAKSKETRFADAKEMLTAIDDLGPEAIRRVGPRRSSEPRDSSASIALGDAATALGPPTQASAASPRGESQRLSAAGAPPRRTALLWVFVAAVGSLLVVGLAIGGFFAWRSIAGGGASLTPTLPSLPSLPQVGPIPMSPSGPTSDARDPFDDPLPEPMARIHRRVESQGGTRISDRQLSALAQYRRENPTDPRPHLLRAHILTDKRSLSYALPEYEQAYELDPTVRGDPSMLPDLLEMVRSETLQMSASAFVIRVYGAEAVNAIDRELTAMLRDSERAHLVALRQQLLDGP